MEQSVYLVYVKPNLELMSSSRNESSTIHTRSKRCRREMRLSTVGARVKC